MFALAVYVAFDWAAVWGNLNRCSPSALAIVPRRLGLGLPNPDLQLPGLRLLANIIIGVFGEFPGEAISDQFCINIRFGIGRANRDQASVLIDTRPMAANEAASRQADQSCFGYGATVPRPFG